MKRSILILAVLVFSLSLHSQFTRAMLQASGLTCAMCNNAINKALQKLPFVAAVKPDIKNASFDIVFKENTDVDIDGLKNAVEDAGFSVAKLKLTGNFNNVKVVNDEHVVIDGRTFHFLGVKEQVLNGEQTITEVDKNFLTTREFKKFSADSKMKCLQTGKAAPCCTKAGIAANTRIYHVTI